VLTAPIPFGNWLPAFAIAIIGLALVEKDGVAVLIGLAIGVIGLIVVSAVIGGVIAAALLVISAIWA
jgi:hypothetical protein